MKHSSTLTVCFQPTQQYIDLVGNWLEAERKQTGKGYKHNWQFILDAHKRQCMAVILKKVDLWDLRTSGNWNFKSVWIFFASKCQEEIKGLEIIFFRH